MNWRPTERLAAIIYRHLSVEPEKGCVSLTIIFMLTSRLTLSMNTSLHPLVHGKHIAQTFRPTIHRDNGSVHPLPPTEKEEGIW